MSRSRTLAVIFAGALGALLTTRPAGADEKKGAEIGAKVDKGWAGFKSEESEISLELVSGDGSKAERKLRGKGREVGSDEQSVMTFVWPADLKGTRLLTWNHRGKADDQWLYLPSIRRVKRISARSRSGSFMGSELAFEDLTNVWWQQKYKYNYLRDQKVGGKRDTWVIERTPKDKDSGYSKQVLWVDKEYVLPLRIEFYDRKGKLLKTTDFKQFKKYGNKWRFDRMEVINRQTGKKTNAVWTSRKMGVSFSDEDFAPDSLSRQ